MQKLISIVIPCFNEQEVIERTYERLRSLNLGKYNKELIFVNDGSRDSTLDILKRLAAQDSDVKVIGFSRNFGHQPAVSAGTAYASGDAIVIIDGDLQDPPELIPEMISKWEQGFDIVYGKRLSRKGETIFKKFTAWGYYRVLNWMGGSYIPRDTGDFRLIDARVGKLLTQMKEHNRFLRGMTAWAGFSQYPVEYVRDERAAGETKYTLKKMIKLASDGITAFSERPLKLPLISGVFLFFASLIYLIVSIILAIAGTWTVFHSLFAALFLFISIILLSLGIMGLYVGRIYDETKNRPLYIVGETVNLEKQPD